MRYLRTGFGRLQCTITAANLNLTIAAYTRHTIQHTFVRRFMKSVAARESTLLFTLITRGICIGNVCRRARCLDYTAILTRYQRTANTTAVTVDNCNILNGTALFRVAARYTPPRHLITDRRAAQTRLTGTPYPVQT